MKMKEKLNVPKGIRYISQWQDFRLPNYPHIMDKQIPGCGFTEYGLTNDQDVVLCSPRKILLENKRDQHTEDVYYLVNDFYSEEPSPDKDLNVRLDLSISKVDKENSDSLRKRVLDPTRDKFYEKKRNELSDYIESRRYNKKPIKILVTYDSFHIVKSVLQHRNLLDTTQIIVDEFQSIFTDSRFKSDTELSFLNYLKDVQKVCYVSATPMMDEYLDQLDYFKDLPYYKLDWKTLDPSRVTRPNLKVRTTRSVFEAAKKIIDSYKSGNFEVYFRRNGEDVVGTESREAVIYVNSVNNILTIIKKSELRPEECNVLCSNTPENLSKINKKLGANFTIGKVPLKGERHKMFTFCTRTVYLGADFYSTNARTFIISDANTETLAVDISLDLPQILGRQRLEENPWKNSAEFYYKPLVESKKRGMTKKIFLERIEKKVAQTDALLRSIENSKGDIEAQQAQAENCLKLAKLLNYRDDYISVNRVPTGEKELLPDGTIVEKVLLVPVANNLVKISEQRAFDIQGIDYADRFSVFNTINEVSGLELGNQETKDFLKEYESLTTLYLKLKYLCERALENRLSNLMLDQITEKNFIDYLNILGPERLRALGYSITEINKELGIVAFDHDRLRSLVHSSFILGNRYSMSDVKTILCDIYKKCGYLKTATAKDLENFFQVSEINASITFLDGSKKRSRGYEILSKKS